MIKVTYNETNGSVGRMAFDSSVEIASPYVTLTEAQWHFLTGRPLKVENGVLTVDLAAAKEEAMEKLWKNYKAFQNRYVDAEDLTLAVVCANGGSAKGAAVQSWVMNLWARYYTVKDAIANAATLEALDGLDLSAESFGAPPCSVRELNEEAAAALRKGSEA